MFKLDTRIFRTKVPLYTTMLFIAISTPGPEFIAEFLKAGNTTMPKALSTKY